MNTAGRNLHTIYTRSPSFLHACAQDPTAGLPLCRYPVASALLASPAFRGRIVGVHTIAGRPIRHPDKRPGAIVPLVWDAKTSSDGGRAGLSSGLIRRGSRASAEDRTRPQLQVTDHADLPRTHVHRLGKRVGRQPSRCLDLASPCHAEQGRQGRASSTFRPAPGLAQPLRPGQARILSSRSDGHEVLVASGTARDRRVPWVIRLYGVLEGGVDREQRVGVGESGDLVQRAAGRIANRTCPPRAVALRWA